MTGASGRYVLPERRPQVGSAVPGASPWGVLNQSWSPFWEAQGIRPPHIRIAVASGRIGTMRSTFWKPLRFCHRFIGTCTNNNKAPNRHDPGLFSKGLFLVFAELGNDTDVFQGAGIALDF
jgi:hypothetical protein